MTKTILITGSTDGIGLAAAKILNRRGHRVVLHGRSREKLDHARSFLTEPGASTGYVADLSNLSEVHRLGSELTNDFDHIDVLVNNAGVYGAAKEKTADGLDLRFAVNTVAPYLLTSQLLVKLPSDGRVVNLSSAAQEAVNLDLMAGNGNTPDDFSVYSQSKLALTMWSVALAKSLDSDSASIIAVNPGSMLGTKMVKQAFGADGKDVSIGAEIVAQAAVSELFAGASGKYYDNDNQSFAAPHSDASNPEKCQAILDRLDRIVQQSIGHFGI